MEVGFPSTARSGTNCLLLYLLKSNVGEGGSQDLSVPGAASPHAVMLGANRLPAWAIGAALPFEHTLYREIWRPLNKGIPALTKPFAMGFLSMNKCRKVTLVNRIFMTGQGT